MTAVTAAADLRRPRARHCCSPLSVYAALPRSAPPTAVVTVPAPSCSYRFMSVKVAASCSWLELGKEDAVDGVAALAHGTWRWRAVLLQQHHPMWAVCVARNTCGQRAVAIEGNFCGGAGCQRRRGVAPMAPGRALTPPTQTSKVPTAFAAAGPQHSCVQRPVSRNYRWTIYCCCCRPGAAELRGVASF